jgi:hypothetical protein
VDLSGGICVEAQGTLACDDGNSFLRNACIGRDEGDVCEIGPATLKIEGRCILEAWEYEDLICNPHAGDGGCVGKKPEDSCLIYAGAGRVQVGKCASIEGDLFCDRYGDGNAGSLVGINIDSCGNLYVSEHHSWKVWRIRRDGSAVEEAATLPETSGVIGTQSMHWGSGFGEWDKNKLYVSDRDGVHFFGLFVGLPGVPEVYP